MSGRPAAAGGCAGPGCRRGCEPPRRWPPQCAPGGGGGGSGARSRQDSRSGPSPSEQPQRKHRHHAAQESMQAGQARAGCKGHCSMCQAHAVHGMTHTVSALHGMHLPHQPSCERPGRQSAARTQPLSGLFQTMDLRWLYTAPAGRTAGCLFAGDYCKAARSEALRPEHAPSQGPPGKAGMVPLLRQLRGALARQSGARSGSLLGPLPCCTAHSRTRKAPADAHGGEEEHALGQGGLG